MKNLIGLGCFALLLVSFSITHKQELYKPFSQKNIKDSTFVCMPCGAACDKLVYLKSGFCSHCNMPLVNKASVSFNNIEPAAICNFLEKKGRQNVLLLDVRTNEEFKGNAPDKFGRLTGAINIPVNELTVRMKELRQYKNKEIVVYCSHSHRSPRASYLLTQSGFKKVTNLLHGMSEWNNLVKESACNKKLFVKQ